ncbi:MAG: GntR family transcriptional regulator [Verrucomicrobia bacterium]|nr:GntR family transcriptional regulator [Verrucomicrobiota bacterium]
MVAPKSTLWKTMAADLRNELSGNTFKRGDIFYPLHSVSQRYNVSLITTKRAYAELEHEGWVKRHRGKGTVVLKHGSKTEIKVFLPENVPLDAAGKCVILEIYTGLAEAARESGCDLVKFSNAGIFLNGSEKNNAFIIIQDFDTFDADQGLAVVRNGSNFTVVVNACSPKENCRSVGIDFKKGAFLAVKHLLSLGHTRIAWVGYNISSPWHTGRFEGYVDALKSAGLQLDWRLVKETTGNADDVFEALAQLAILRNPPTAVFADNDGRAFHVLEFCKQRGLRVPEEMSVIGFDNFPESAMTIPPLTTMETHLKQMGKEAVYLVLDLMNGKKTNQNLLIPPELVLRKSTGPRPSSVTSDQ